MPDSHQVLTVDALAQEIRRVDGSHSLGAGALAEALWPFIERAVLTKMAGQVRDAERLDAMIAHPSWSISHYKGRYRINTASEVLTDWHDDPRAAIDAARTPHGGQDDLEAIRSALGETPNV